MNNKAMSVEAFDKLQDVLVEAFEQAVMVGPTLHERASNIIEGVHALMEMQRYREEHPEMKYKSLQFSSKIDKF